MGKRFGDEKVDRDLMNVIKVLSKEINGHASISLVCNIMEAVGYDREMIYKKLDKGHAENKIFYVGIGLLRVW